MERRRHTYACTTDGAEWQIDEETTVVVYWQDQEQNFMAQK